MLKDYSKIRYNLLFYFLAWEQDVLLKEEQLD